MIGTSMACALGKSEYMKDKKILLIDSEKENDTAILDKPGDYSNRVCAISPGSIDLLTKIGIWDHIPRSGPVKRMQVWDACSDATIFFNGKYEDSNENTSDEICHITENNMIVSASMREVQTTNVDVKCGVKIVDCETPSEHTDSTQLMPSAKITLSNGSTYSAKLIIGADGANSFLAKKAELPKIGWNYQSNAVVATLKLSEPCSNTTAWQRFLPQGPLALLPLDDNHSSLVWSTSPEHAQLLCELSNEDLILEINDALWQTHTQNDMVASAHSKVKQFISLLSPDNFTIQQYPPSVMNVIGKAQQFPLGLSHTHWYIKSRIAFIGDAVHRIHPLAGQGANMGFRDIKNLVKAIEDSIYEGRDIGHLSSLKDYESRSQLNNIPIMFGTDVLKRLYSTDFWPVVLLRSSGLEITNALTPLKEFLQKRAMS